MGSKFSDLFKNLQLQYSHHVDVLTPSSAQLDNLKKSHDIDYINKVVNNELTKD